MILECSSVPIVLNWFLGTFEFSNSTNNVSLKRFPRKAFN